MISKRNIDLTEHLDFGAHDFMGIGHNKLVPPIEVMSGKMTFKEYNALIRRETFFGQKMHRTEAHKVFNNPFMNFNDKNGVPICERCGRTLRVPWKRRYGLCEKCANEMDNEKTPWGISLNASNIDKGYELFNLR